MSSELRIDSQWPEMDSEDLAVTLVMDHLARLTPRDVAEHVDWHAGEETTGELRRLTAEALSDARITIACGVGPEAATFRIGDEEAVRRDVLALPYWTAGLVTRAVEVYCLLLLGQEIEAGLIVDRHATEEEGATAARVVAALDPDRAARVRQVAA